MRIGSPGCLGRVALALGAAALALPLTADESALIGEESDAVVELRGETRLEIVGLSGTIALRVGKSGGLRYAARSESDRSEDRAVGLWSDGSTLRLTAAEAQAADGLLLEVAVPSDLRSVRIQTAGSKVSANDLASDLEIVGERLTLEIGRQMAALRLELQESTGRLAWAQADTSVEGRDLQLTLSSVRGLVRLRVGSSKVTLEQVSALEAELEATDLVATTVHGAASIDARGGSLELKNMNGGAELNLTGTPLVLASTKGAVKVETDSAVQFSAVHGDLSVASYNYGARVQGQGVSGKLEVETNGAEVVLEQLEGQTQIRGDGLQLRVTGSRGEISIRVTSSTVTLEQVDGPVLVENDFGDVLVSGAKHRVQVVNRMGGVRAIDLSGSLDLRADGPGVDVSFTALAGEEDSHVENSSGDVRLHLPASGGCRIDATAPNGVIQSDLEGVRVSPDGTTASGLLGGGGRQPLLTIRSGGDIYVDGAPRSGRQ